MQSKNKKILVKSFIEGAYLANKIKNFDTFLAEIKDDNTKIFYFENNSQI